MTVGLTFANFWQVTKKGKCLYREEGGGGGFEYEIEKTGPFANTLK